MTQIFKLDQIKSVLERLDPLQAIEEGFVAYSQGRAVIPPVGELIFYDPPGDMHIKYGCLKDGDYYVVKIASGFYENYKLNLPNCDGLMLLFSQKTGHLACILLDEGHLTNVRTAAAGAVVAKYLAPKSVRNIGVLGAGIQGRMQIQYLKGITSCREIYVWGINEQELSGYQNDMEAQGFSVQATLDAGEIPENCNLIVTATPSQSPLLRYDQIRPGTHITAVGADTPEKNELDPQILERADIVVADSLSQCQSRGEIFKALEAGCLKTNEVTELGHMIRSPDLQRRADEQITVADLTGVAVQDIQIAVAVFEELSPASASHPEEKIDR